MKKIMARSAFPAALALAMLLGSCAPLRLQQNKDPLSAALFPQINRPVLVMANRFGQPAQQTVEKGERWYIWRFQDPACEISARVDDQENVIDAYWSGSRDACARVIEARPFL